MADDPPNVDRQKFLELVRAEGIYRASHYCPLFRNAVNIPFIVQRFLTVGSTYTFNRSGKAVKDDFGIKNIIESGYGSVALRELAENVTPHFSQRKNHVALFVNLCMASHVQIVNEEFQNYLRALRLATRTIFSVKIQYPFDLENFLDLTLNANWGLWYQKLVSTWYTGKNTEQMNNFLYFWKFNGILDHEDIWAMCSASVQDPIVAEYIFGLISRSDNESFEEKFKGQLIVDLLGEDLVISQLANSQIGKALKKHDKNRIASFLKDESWLMNTSPLEILLVRKKYEANHDITPDIYLCGLLNEAYRRLCETEIHTGQRVCVISGVFKNESKKIDKIMLESIDLATALTEDLMRNNQSKTATFGPIPNKKGLYNKQNMASKCIADLQKSQCHPVRLLENVSRMQEVFDSFVFVLITGAHLPFHAVITAFQVYRTTINCRAKLIIVGVDHLEAVNGDWNRDNVLMISGVDEGTSALLWKYMSLQ